MAWIKRDLKGFLSFKGLNFGFECKKVKYLRLKFSSKGEFTLSVPYGYTEKMLYEFLQKNEKWIEKRQASFEKKSRENAGKIEFLGKFYELKFDKKVKKPFFAKSEFGENSRDSSELNANLLGENSFDESVLAEFDIKAFAKNIFDKNVLAVRDEAQLKEFLRENARKICLFYVKKWQGHFAGRISRVSVKSMKTRWGSCNSKKGYINLSTRLIHKPLGAIEYVILHELTHLKFPHHQASFYAHIERLMPDFKAREKLLK